MFNRKQVCRELINHKRLVFFLKSYSFNSLYYSNLLYFIHLCGVGHRVFRFVIRATLRTLMVAHSKVGLKSGLVKKSL